MTDAELARPLDGAKWLLFVGLGLLVVYSAWLDDRFVFNAKDPEWGKFATWWGLAPHALAGVAALLIGPFQFSDRLRATRPQLHRLMGRTYAIASLVAGPLAGVIAWTHHSRGLAIGQVALAFLWTLTTLMAWLNALARNIPSHKLWMMRSYGFCLVFVLGRLPDAIPHFDWDGVPGVAETWASVALALVAPDLMLNVRDLMRRRRRTA